jgi:hypothetical protein
VEDAYSTSHACPSIDLEVLSGAVVACWWVLVGISSGVKSHTTNSEPEVVSRIPQLESTELVSVISPPPFGDPDAVGH